MLDFEADELRREIAATGRESSTGGGKITQSERNEWDKILAEEKKARKRVEERNARNEMLRRRAAQRADASAPRAPPPNLDEVRLNLFTVLPDPMSRALGDKIADILGQSGGTDAVISDPTRFADVIAELLAIPKVCLRKERGKSGAEQRKQVYRNLGANPPAAEDAQIDEPTAADKTADESSVSRALRFFSLGFLGRAARAIDAEEVPQLPDDIAFEKLCALHPAAVRMMPRLARKEWRTIVDPEALQELVRRMANGAAAGPDGWTEDLLSPLLVDPSFLRFATCFVQTIVDGKPPCERKRLVASRLVGIPKPDGGIRPIAVGSVWLKIAARYIFHVHGEASPTGGKKNEESG